jgi:hypothetical protein
MTRPGRARVIAVAALAAAVAFAQACGKPSEEVRIRELLKEAVRRAEKKDIARLEGLFAPGYADFEGRDTNGTIRLVTDHLDRYRGVVIHLLGARVGDIDPDGLASVECEVSLSHGAAEVLRKLIRYAGEYYRFRIDLRKDGPSGWRFTYAEWRPIGLTEVFPESLAILKELFPDL